MFQFELNKMDIFMSKKKVALFVGQEVFSLMLYQALILLCKKEKIEFIIIMDDKVIKTDNSPLYSRHYLYKEEDILQAYLFPFLKSRVITTGLFLEHEIFLKKNNLHYYYGHSDISNITFLNFLDSMVDGVIFIGFSKKIPSIYQHIFTRKGKFCWEYNNRVRLDLSTKFLNKNNQKNTFLVWNFINPRKKSLLLKIERNVEHRYSSTLNTLLCISHIASDLKYKLFENTCCTREYFGPFFIPDCFNRPIIYKTKRLQTFIDEKALFLLFYELFVSKECSFLSSQFRHIFFY